MAQAIQLQEIPNTFTYPSLQNNPSIAYTRFRVEGYLFRTESTPLYYNDRVRISLQVADTFRSQFALVRGLIEFNRPADFSFTYDRDQGIINLDLAQEAWSEAELFLARIADEFQAERAFRQVLREVRILEERQAQERVALYASLATAARSV